MLLSTRTPLADAFWFQEGPGVRNTQFRDSGVKLLNVSNITKDGKIDLGKTDRHLEKSEAFGKYKHFLVDAGDLVIASSGISIDSDELLRTRGAFVEEYHLPLCMNTSTIRFKALQGKSHLQYLKHWLQSTDFRSQITRLVTGSAQKNFGPSHLKQLWINLPPLPEQRRIAAILDQADLLRAKRREALAKLDEMAKAIFVEMFGNEDCNDRQVRLDEFAEVQIGYPFQSSLYTEDKSGIRLCRGTNVLPNEIDWHDTVRWPFQDAARFVDFSLQEDDILIAMDRPWISSGFKVARITKADLPSLLVQRVARLRTEQKAQGIFLHFLINGPDFEKHCRTTETTVPHISPKDIKSFRFNRPSVERQIQFGERVGNIWDLRDLALKCSDLESALFSSLQHRAFSGDL